MTQLLLSIKEENAKEQCALILETWHLDIEDFHRAP